MLWPPPKSFHRCVTSSEIPVSVTLVSTVHEKKAELSKVQWLLRTTILLCGTPGCNQLSKAPPMSPGKRETSPQEGRSGSCRFPDEHRPSLCFSLPTASSYPLAGQLSPPDRKPGPPAFQNPILASSPQRGKALGPPVPNFWDMGLKRP